MGTPLGWNWTATLSEQHGVVMVYQPQVTNSAGRHRFHLPLVRRRLPTDWANEHGAASTFNGPDWLLTLCGRPARVDNRYIFGLVDRARCRRSSASIHVQARCRSTSTLNRLQQAGASDGYGEMVRP